MSDKVVLRIQDDGRGISSQKILSRAQAKGLVSAEALEWPEQQVIDLLFAAGFSTKESVSETSGRGVGLDAVRAGATKIGGQVRILNRGLGKGSIFEIEIPS